MVSRLSAWILSGLAGMCICVSSAQAQDYQEFKAKMEQASKAAKTDLDEALKQYLEIHVRFAAPEIDYSLARAYHLLGQCSEALYYYSRVMGVGLPQESVVLQRSTKAYDEIADCSSWQTVKLNCEMPQGAYVVVDDERIGSCWSRPMSLPDGTHTFTLMSEDGTVESSREVELVSGEPEIEVELLSKKNEYEDLEDFKRKEYLYNPALYWGLLTGGVALMGTSGIFFALAHSAHSDEIKYSGSYAVSRSEKDQKKAQDARDDVKLNRTLSYTFLGVGAGVAMTGVILAIMDGVYRSKRKNYTNIMSPTIAPTDGGLAVGFGMEF